MLQFDVFQFDGRFHARDPAALDGRPALFAADQFRSEERVDPVDEPRFEETRVDRAAALHEDAVDVPLRQDDNAVWYTISASPDLLRYIVEKGSICIDGISLTVAAVDDRSFQVSIIPHTRAVTNLSTKGVGSTVNLECDVIGKYVEKLLGPYGGSGGTSPQEEKSSGITEAFLREYGF